MRSQYCYEDAGQYDCFKFDNVCVKPQIARTADEPWHVSCDPYMQIPADSTWGSWDSKVHHMGQKCVDLHNDTQAECEGYNGVWTSTFMNRTICEESDRFCVAADGHHYRNMDSSTCSSCGGFWQSHAQWEAAQWHIPSMVESTSGEPAHKWVSKAVEPVNKWTTVLYEDGLRDVVNVFKEPIMTQPNPSLDPT